MTEDGLSDRLAGVVSLLTRLARGELDARGELTGSDDEVDALVVGVNMLAEELEAGQAEMEGRVHARTLELEEMVQDITRLTELGNLLQACDDKDEAYEVIEQVVTLIFPGLAGALYLFNASRNLLELKSVWGDLPSDRIFARESCWALRRGQRHHVLGEHRRLSCAHTHGRTGDSICIPMSAHGETLGMFHLMDRHLEPGHAHERLTVPKQQLAVTVAENIALSLANLEMRATLRQQAIRDSLTGLFNRRFLDEWIEREISRADHAGTSLGVIMADIDHFKQFNDAHGHDAGDAVLSAVAAAISQSMRAGDVPCRYGGEEFLILVAGIDRDSLLARAEHLRVAVAQARVDTLGTRLPTVTVSIGLSLFPEHGTTPVQVLKKADEALYAAKARGRNCVEMAGAR